MRSVNRKDLMTAAKTGNANMDSVQKALFANDAPDLDIDDQDPMDRVADELAKFSEAVRIALGASRTNEVAEALQVVRKAMEKISEPKDAPAPVEVNIDVADTRPKAWDITVTQYDDAGRISRMRVTAEK